MFAGKGGYTFLVRSVLMTEDLPTLGYPTNPTEMYFLSDRSRDSWRSRLSRLPLPKGFVMLAWNASVGNSRDRVCSQRFVTQAGTCKGHNITCRTELSPVPREF